MSSLFVAAVKTRKLLLLFVGYISLVTSLQFYVQRIMFHSFWFINLRTNVKPQCTCRGASIKYLFGTRGIMLVIMLLRFICQVYTKYLMRERGENAEQRERGNINVFCCR